MRKQVKALFRAIRSRTSRRPPSCVSGADHVQIAIRSDRLEIRADGVLVFTGTQIKSIRIVDRFDDGRASPIQQMVDADLFANDMTGDSGGITPNTFGAASRKPD
jgi:hypothetical protein